MASPLAPGKAAALRALAPLFSYPAKDFSRRVEEARSAMASCPASSSLLEPFLRYATNATPTELEEGYARTFDWSPTCALEVGWHLYGEQYDRGAFLVAMRARLRDAGVEEGVDLPDHAGHCLRWLARADEEEGDVFAKGALVPALQAIRKGLETAGSPTAVAYAALVHATLSLLPDAPPRPPAAVSCSASSCGLVPEDPS